MCVCIVSLWQYLHNSRWTIFCFLFEIFFFPLIHCINDELHENNGLAIMLQQTDLERGGCRYDWLNEKKLRNFPLGAVRASEARSARTKEAGCCVFLQTVAYCCRCSPLTDNNWKKMLALRKKNAMWTQALKLQLVTSKTLCSVWKNCHNTHRQLLVSDVVWEYGEISVFSHHASVLRIGKNPTAPILFAQSVTLSVLSVLICLSTLPFLATGDVATSWLAVRALRSDSTTECQQAAPSVGSSSSWDGPVYSAATFPATVWSQFKLDSTEDRQQLK